MKNWEIANLCNDRLYIVDINSDQSDYELTNNHDKKSFGSETKNKCKALSKRIKPLTDKFETDYICLSLIGSGNFGQVFKAKNKRNGKIWAVKKSKHQFISYKDRRVKEEEIRKWRIITEHAIKNPYQNSHCIELYEAWEENGYIFSSSEYWENGNFAEWISSRSVSLSKYEIQKWILDMSLAIKQVHDWNIVHMDIKPDNFLVKADNSIKLGDFGLAIVLSTSNYSSKNNENLQESIRYQNQNISEGDASYLAPELLGFNAKPSKKVDIFSFGASIIEWFNWSGITKLPVNGDLWQRIRDENPSEFINFPDSLLANLVNKMTNKDPSKRITINEVINSSFLKQYKSNK